MAALSTLIARYKLTFKKSSLRHTDDLEKKSSIISKFEE